ncbi:MAG: glycosyltransferase family 39 protein [Bacteroidales bacterium]|nr:glycosyltransferase family 39 protein [Bacteroidales bacterium]
MASGNHPQRTLWSTDHVLLLVILAAGAVLRFYRIGDIPFTYDEYSALFRLHFEHFRDLITQGVMVDAHPAGVHVFLYYWTRLFGESEPMVKLPFIICGLASIYLGYIIGREWVNATAGLILALFLAVLQYPVMYSQIARPYISGMFLSLLMAWAWARVIKAQTRRPYLFLVIYIISSTLAAYNHHFSLLLTGLVWISGLFLIGKEKFKIYFIAGILIFILYIPHLPIFFRQLSYGGVEEWLGKPTPAFLAYYLGFILHFSPLMIITVVSLILAGWTFWRHKPPLKPALPVTGLIWFVITLIIGYIYSLRINSVLQFSVLIFTFPFLVLGLFSGIKNLKPGLKVILVVVFIGFSAATLIFKREYYRHFYLSGYEAVIHESAGANLKYGGRNITHIVNTHPRIHNYCMTKTGYEGRLHLLHLDSLGGGAQLKGKLQQINTPYLTVGWAEGFNLDEFQVIREVYPGVVGKKNGYAWEFWVLSRDSLPEGVPGAERIIFQTRQGFDGEVTGWGHSVGSDTCNGCPAPPCFCMDSKQEYSPGFSSHIRNIIAHHNNIIEVSALICPEEPFQDVLLVTDISRNGRSIHWSSSSARHFMNGTDRQVRIHHSVKLPDIETGAADTRIMVYLWNRQGSVFCLDDLSVTVREGNPFIYCLYEDF